MIGELLNRNEVSSQEQLLALLQVEGCDLVQSTLSRDLRQLAVDKRDGFYRLPKRGQAPRDSFERLRRTLASELDFVDCGGTIAVLKPRDPSRRQALKQQLDREQLPSIVAVTTTEDTLLVVLRSAAMARDLVQQLRIRPKRAWAIS
jgi:transcriptional regulator of arginine metabolism